MSAHPTLMERLHAHQAKYASAPDLALLTRPERRAEIAADLAAVVAHIRQLEAALATAHTRGAEWGLEAAAELAATVYLQMIGWDAVSCGCGNGRIPTAAYRKAVDAYAAAIRQLPIPPSPEGEGK